MTLFHDGLPRRDYAFAHWGNLVVHLAQDDHPEAHMTSVRYIHVDDADELAADWRKAGMEVIGPEHEDNGKREGQHTDPDGTTSSGSGQADSQLNHQRPTIPWRLQMVIGDIPDSERSLGGAGSWPWDFTEKRFFLDSKTR